MVRRAIGLSAVALTVGLAVCALLFSASSKETKLFDARPGDTVIIRVDYGRVRITSWQQPNVQAEIERVALQQSQLGNIEVITHKQADKIYASAFFYDYAGESVNLDLWVPPFLNVVVWGGNAAVQVTGIDGYVRVHSLTGSVSAEDLTGSVSLIADGGDILYRARRQLTTDVRLEAVKGNIRCELQRDLNFRGWARAGRKLQWNGEVEMNKGALERQVGLGGPLCLASSIAGDVTFSLPAQLASAPSSLPREAAPESTVEVQQPQEPNPAAPDPQAPPVIRAPSTPAQGGDPGGYKVRVNVEWIYLNASVRERNSNRSVPDLRKEDFQVYEDGVRQTVGRFSATESPFHLVLLLDVSGSTEEYMGLIKEASIEFAREIGPNDRIALATFNSSLRWRQDFTNDRDAVIDEIRQVRSGGGTAFYDALKGCLREHTDRIEGRKAIVVFTDGVDNQLQGDPGAGSTTRFSELYRDIQDSEALIYTIFLDTAGTGGVYGGSGGRQGSVIDILEDIMRGRVPSSRGPRGGGSRSGGSEIQEARTQLESIAEQTGARMYSPNRIEDLSHAYREIADDLRVQYTLGYNSSNGIKDGKWRRIKVSIANRPELDVRTRKGYYAGEAEKKASVSKTPFQ